MKQTELSYFALEAAGVYPYRVHLSNGEVKERTEWENGWNAAIDKINEYWDALWSWYSHQSPEIQKAVDFFCAEEALSFSFDDEGGVYLLFNMNDTFAYACADAEEVQPEELVKLAGLFVQYNWAALIAWASKKRGYLPIEPHQTEDFNTVFAQL